MSFNFQKKQYTVNGTDFQIKIWRELLKISAGQIITYAELSRRIGKPTASRAAANACGANPLPGIIPCHRAVRSDGALGGYSGTGGVKRKRKLLASEGVSFVE